MTQSEFSTVWVEGKEIQRPWNPKNIPLIAGVCTGGCGVFVLRVGSFEDDASPDCPHGSKHFFSRVRWCRDCGAWLIHTENTPRRCKGKGLGHHEPTVLFEALAGTTDPAKFVPPQEPPRRRRLRLRWH